MYAIETKKRKFDRILQSINKSQTSLPIPESKEATKKRRVSAPQSLLSKYPRASSNNASTTSLNRPRPNYLPQSQEAFLERLYTFSPVQSWHISSAEPINAAEWAKKGWSCVGEDMVACKGGCNEQLIVRLEDEAASPEEEKDPESTDVPDIDGFDEPAEAEQKRTLSPTP
ncbi:MAG: hypothetical protein Q9227_002043 [Pyrenula ochraceoflavens]